MKTLTTLNRNTIGIFSAAAFIALMASPASAGNFDKGIESDLVQICEAIKSDNKMKLNRKLKSANLSYRTISKGLVCNGMSVHDFAQKHQASNTGELLAKRARVNNTLLSANKAY